ncbi:MAG: RNA polymerase sigma factor [Thermodesulfobacteriota bacterium]
MELALDSKATLDRFLADVERRAFRMAKFASGNTDEALDLVQEAMLQFVRRYANRPPEEWNPLFYRVLKSRITDWYRRTFVRKRFLAWLGRADEEEQEDPLQNLPDPANPNPSDHILRQEERTALEKAIRRLPLRQQQAFLLRAWEGMDVAQAAFAMGCSEGSIKTHYSRAVHTLRGLLEDQRS